MHRLSVSICDLNFENHTGFKIIIELKYKLNGNRRDGDFPRLLPENHY